MQFLKIIRVTEWTRDWGSREERRKTIQSPDNSRLSHGSVEQTKKSVRILKRQPHGASGYAIEQHSSRTWRRKAKRLPVLL